MQVKKCDRCGAVYDNAKEGYIVSHTSEKEYYICSKFEKADLCNRCFSEFERWMRTACDRPSIFEQYGQKMQSAINEALASTDKK